MVVELQIGEYTILVSAEDVEWISQYKWYPQLNPCKNKFMVYFCTKINNKKIRLHREILIRQGINIEGKLGDHKNRNTLDNTRENLRVATHSENCVNRHDGINITGARGVWYRVRKYIKKSGEITYMYSWVAKIKKNQKYVFRKQYQTFLEAVKAYDDAAIKIYGEYAITNKQLGLY